MIKLILILMALMNFGFAQIKGTGGDDIGGDYGLSDKLSKSCLEAIEVKDESYKSLVKALKKKFPKLELSDENILSTFLFILGSEEFIQEKLNGDQLSQKLGCNKSELTVKGDELKDSSHLRVLFKLLDKSFEGISAHCPVHYWSDSSVNSNFSLIKRQEQLSKILELLGE